MPAFGQKAEGEHQPADPQKAGPAGAFDERQTACGKKEDVNGIRIRISGGVPVKEIIECEKQHHGAEGRRFSVTAKKIEGDQEKGEKHRQRGIEAHAENARAEEAKAQDDAPVAQGRL